MLETLAPAGNREALDRAVAAGANAVYLGYAAFSARAGAGRQRERERAMRRERVRRQSGPFLPVRAIAISLAPSLPGPAARLPFFAVPIIVCCGPAVKSGAALCLKKQGGARRIPRQAPPCFRRVLRCGTRCISRCRRLP